MLSKDGLTIIDRREMLKIKCLSLAAEARIIRRLEKRTRGPLREEIHLHRVRIVRDEARLSHIALGLIRGRTIDQMEAKVHPQNALKPGHWDRIRAMVKRYGATGQEAKLKLAA
jgi:hypothetical protein